MNDYSLRYQLAKDMLRSWLGRLGNSQARLAFLIGVEESEISRFRPCAEYEPTPRRPAKIRLLEKIENVCGAPGEVDYSVPKNEEEGEWLKSDYGATHLEFQRGIEGILKLPAPRGLEELRTY